MNSYHDHKENLAHAAILVMGGMVGSILLTAPWPPKWITYTCPKLLAFIVFSFLWFLIHLYMRWQLRQRRSAAIMFSAATRKLTAWIEQPPAPDELKPSTKQPPGCFNMFLFYLDHLIVCRKGILIEHIAGLYPNCLVVSYERERKEMHQIPSEWLLTLASFFLYFLVILRTWCF